MPVPVISANPNRRGALFVEVWPPLFGCFRPTYPTPGRIEDKLSSYLAGEVVSAVLQLRSDVPASCWLLPIRIFGTSMNAFNLVELERASNERARAPEKGQLLTFVDGLQNGNGGVGGFSGSYAGTGSFKLLEIETCSIEVLVDHTSKTSRDD
jgi:hypothetical protein